MFRAVDDQRVVGVDSCQGAHVPVLTEGGGDVLQELDCPAHFNDAGMSQPAVISEVTSANRISGDDDDVYYYNC